MAVAGGSHLRPQVAIAPEALARVVRAREVLERAAAGDRPIYGVNTGFGHLAYVKVARELAGSLQANLIRSHAMGVGPPLGIEESRAVMVLRLNSLLHGRSGVRPALVELLAAMINRDVVPVIPSWGSVGASGDLVPLAHLALGMMGEGEAWRAGRRMPAASALEEAGLQPLRPELKEGLALVNGTEVTTAIGTLALGKLERVTLALDVACALSIEALAGSAEPFDERLAAARPHPQVAAVAGNLRKLLAGSRRLRSPGEGPPQDAYSLRAAPAVHGAAREAFAWAARVAATEMDSAVDNPLVFPEDGAILSGANFHAQPLAVAWDGCRVGVATLAGISERRIDRLVNPHLSGGLPPFLSRRSGLQSGLMMAQYVAAALAGELRFLAAPASVHTIPTSAGQEDVVSLGATAARALKGSVERLARVCALELICAAQAVEFRDAPLSPAGAAVFSWVRQRVPPVDSEDRSLSQAVEDLAERVLAGEPVEVARQATGCELTGFLTPPA
ncbi:MAG: histidine ammonia-lyase [Bacillota bacterium]